MGTHLDRIHHRREGALMTVPTDTTVSITSGKLRGSRQDGIARYLGVPYAAAPVGDLRFALAAPHPGWAGVRDATSMGASVPQTPYGEAFFDLLPQVVVDGDEYLNVNIWAPENAAGLPVMVWVHGGGLTHGSNSLLGYDGTTFARDGVVFVSINYRLSAEGFSVLQDAPLNIGLGDVMAALRWVKREISSFGGDAGQVTVFGQSAGSILLGSVVAHPEASTLFARAILQSGAPTAVPRKSAGRISKLEAQQLGVAATRAAFAPIPSDQLLAAEQKATAGGTPLTGGAGYSMAIGDDLVPRDPLTAVLAGAGNDIQILAGSTSEEYRFWFLPLGLMNKIGRLFFLAVRLRFRVNGTVIRAYRNNLTDRSRGALFGALVTDVVVRLPLNRIADARLAAGVKTWIYEFTWPSPVLDMGAAHAIELGFVFDDIHSPDWVKLTGLDAPQQLADDMHSAWVKFAKTGDPGWEPWNSRRPVQTFDAPASAIVYAPREDERSAWGKRG
jgi:para-nitrobenzyl esterase